jgi:HEAT repeat protein
VSDRLSRFRFGVRAPLLLIAFLTLAAWGVLAYWDFAANDDPLQQIRSRNVENRRSAAANLRVLTKKTDLTATTAALAHALRDQDQDVRILAAQSVGQLLPQLRFQPDTTPEEKKFLGTHVETLFGLLAGALSSDASVQVRTTLVESMMGAARPGRSVTWTPAMVAAVEEGSVVWNRAVAREYLGLSEATPPPALISALNDASAEVRAKAALVLRQFPLNLDPVIPELLSRMASDDSTVGKECGVTLHWAYPTAAVVPTLVAALADSHRENRSVAAYLLGKIGPEAEAAVPALLEMLKESVRPVRGQSDPSQQASDSPPCRAASALGKIAKSAEVVAALDGLLASDDEDRIAAAADGLAVIGNPAVAAVPSLIAVYDRALKADKVYPLLSRVSDALSRIAPNSPYANEVVDRLMRCLDSKDTSVKHFGVRALTKFGPSAVAALPKLVTLADDNDLAVRRAVAAARRAIDAPPKPTFPTQDHN